MSTFDWIRTGGEVLLVLGVVYGGISYLDQREEFARWEAMAEERAEQIDILRAVNDSLARAKARIDSAAYTDSVHLAAARDSLRQRREVAEVATEAAIEGADSTASALDSTLAALRRQAAERAPSLVPRVDTARAQLQAHTSRDSSVIQGYERQLAAQVELTMNRDSLARVNWRRWQAAEAAYRGAVQELSEQRKQTQFWKQKASPSFLQALGRETPKLVGAFAAGAGACAAFC